jgi:hypothetical protein
MAYDKYRSATELGTGSITTEHDALWVGSNTGGTGGTDGDLKVKLVKDDTAVTFKGISDGTLLPIEVKEIVDADTKCSEIVSLESGERWSN